MNIDKSRQSAFEAMDVFMSAAGQPDSLRISKSGELTVTNGLVTLFNRAVSKLRRRIDQDYKPIDWHAKAREAVLNKLAKEVSMFSDGTRREDVQILDKLIADVSASAQSSRPDTWRIRFAQEIAALKNAHIDDPLISALEKIDFFGQPGNRVLFPHVRKHLAGEGSLPKALEMGLKSYLTKDRGLKRETAGNASKNLAKVMIEYGSDVHEAIDIACKAGSTILDKKIDTNNESVLQQAYLQVHHGISLDEATKICNELRREKKTVANALEEVKLMARHGMPFDLAQAIVALGSSLSKESDLESLTKAQKIEIAWLRLSEDVAPEEAILISLQAGGDEGEFTLARAKTLRALVAPLREHIEALISKVLPAGWPEDWNSSANGAKQLVDTTHLTRYFFKYLKDSLSEGGIDTKSGLATKFLADAGRTHFKFGSGPAAKKVHTDSDEAITALKDFEPDPKIRESLSRALFQAGGNGLVAAYTEQLKTNAGKNFGIMTVDVDEEKSLNPTFWISVQRTDENKIRVGYTIYLKHFSIDNPDLTHPIRINDRFNRTDKANESDFTGYSQGAIEFDPEQLRKGIIDPQPFGEVKLTMIVEPDRGSIVRNMIKQNFGIYL